MAMVLRIVGDLPVPVDRVRLGGGGNRSELWRRMQADLYGVPVASMNVEEGPAFGAALMAGVGSGLFESLPAAADASVHETEVLDPSPPSVYTHLLAEQEAIYHALQPRFAQLARSQ
jgi:xylulokinase